VGRRDVCIDAAFAGNKKLAMLYAAGMRILAAATEMFIFEESTNNIGTFNVHFAYSVTIFAYSFLWSCANFPGNERLSVPIVRITLGMLVYCTVKWFAGSEGRRSARGKEERSLGGSRPGIAARILTYMLGGSGGGRWSG